MLQLSAVEAASGLTHGGWAVIGAAYPFGLVARFPSLPCHALAVLIHILVKTGETRHAPPAMLRARVGYKIDADTAAGPVPGEGNGRAPLVAPMSGPVQAAVAQ